MPPQAPTDLLTDILKEVSRSFYRTLRFLPVKVRTQISLAYLLARTSDTIADTDLIPAPERLKALSQFRDSILSESAPAPQFTQIATAQASNGERVILDRAPEALSLLRKQSPVDQGHMRNVLDTIISGQELDLQRFAAASEKHIFALRNAMELDDYTYRVAGCVGEFWTEMTLAHCLPRWTTPNGFKEQGIRFGKGLQLINILRDIPRDLRQGRCYLPADELAAIGLTTEELLKPENAERLRPVYEKWCNLCEAHLEAGWAYTCALPWTAPRLRLACAMPVLIGIRTLRLLRARNYLDPAERIKVSRDEVKSILRQSVALYPFRAKWERLFTTV